MATTEAQRRAAKKYYEKNKKAHHARCVKWQNENKEEYQKKVYARQKERYQNDPVYREKVLARQRAYRARKRAENAKLEQ